MKKMRLLNRDDKKKILSSISEKIPEGRITRKKS